MTCIDPLRRDCTRNPVRFFTPIHHSASPDPSVRQTDCSEKQEPAIPRPGFFRPLRPVGGNPNPEPGLRRTRSSQGSTPSSPTIVCGTVGVSHRQHSVPCSLARRARVLDTNLAGFTENALPHSHLPGLMRPQRLFRPERLDRKPLRHSLCQ